MMKDLRELSKAQLQELTDKTAAADRILAYLKLFVGEIIEGRELEIVGGIQDFARRIRELRKESGYNVSTGYSRDDLRPDQYVLESLRPDKKAADKWKTANSIRRRPGGGMGRIIKLLKHYVGQEVTGEQISYVAKIRTSARRVRQLRREFGWRIVTRQTGRPGLPAGVYILESEDQLPLHDRRIPDDVYDTVLERDNNCCRYCGWSSVNRSPSGRKQFLEVHHIEYHHEGGQNNTENLIALCNVHHDEIHRRGTRGADFWRWLEN